MRKARRRWGRRGREDKGQRGFAGSSWKGARDEVRTPMATDGDRSKRRGKGQRSVFGLDEEGVQVGMLSEVW